MREHIDHSRPLVYEFRDLKTGDVLVFDNHEDARAQLLRADPSHPCEIIARNARVSNLRLDNEDNGNCRVYYKDGKKVFCWQLDRPGQFSFFTCSRDGEPSYEITGDIWCPLPDGKTAIGRELRDFLEMKRAIHAMTNNKGETV